MKVKDRKCYVTPPEPNTGKQPICSFFWQRKGSKGNKYMAQIPVWVDNGGYGAYHEAVISQNPRRFVGDQLSISGDEMGVCYKCLWSKKQTWF